MRGTLAVVSQKIQRAATTTYADQFAAQRLGDMLIKLGKSDEPRQIFLAAHQSATDRVAT